MKKFEWTDEAAIAFVNVYSGNFNHTTPPACTYSRYRGLKMKEKLELFKQDWAGFETPLCPCCKKPSL